MYTGYVGKKFAEVHYVDAVLYNPCHNFLVIPVPIAITSLHTHARVSNCHCASRCWEEEVQCIQVYMLGFRIYFYSNSVHFASQLAHLRVQ